MMQNKLFCFNILITKLKSHKNFVIKKSKPQINAMLAKFRTLLQQIRPFVTNEFLRNIANLLILNFRDTSTSSNQKFECNNIAMSRYNRYLIFIWKQVSNFGIFYIITLWTPTPQNGQTHSNNLSTTANELFASLTIL